MTPFYPETLSVSEIKYILRHQFPPWTKETMMRRVWLGHLRKAEGKGKTQ